MGFRIQTNSMASKALRHYGGHNATVSHSTSRLASGKRINWAADDAAGLAVSDNLRARVRSLNMARRNSLDALSVMEVAETGFVETTNILVRLKEIAIQAGSDTVGKDERQYLDREYVTLKDEIDRIAASVEFNGVRLNMGLPNSPSATYKDLKSQHLDYPVQFQIDASYFSELDAASSKSPVNVMTINLSDLVAFTHGDNSLKLGEGANGTRLISKVMAHQSLARIDTALQTVAKHRSMLGSTQTRLQEVMLNLKEQTSNLTESNSRIIDTDFAVETANYVQGTVLRQSSTSVLMQANAQPSVALSLLQS